ncbi:MULTISPECIES: hypothetical protein [unclassified Variovorax]|uniref:hypothetical protein n=1 Tax=unclassified Variovorax TaxID=663243 RepID=UPI00076CF2D9|nr:MULTISPECIES: hypothetical protein [unclassified Variovorax]KWT64998.1 hypothetical protein APY03_7451 [Variovorax sp. WDL1]PNG49134.1 hypothetical protein CHC06_06371 [Variovorax sp. B2]PNG49519.1 hypothetical protein CHC07_06428 [Variovorax sp. B4]VTV18845.1 hypothetical protein WDL1P2_00469 [Variovorax sp. WDL1]
MDPRQTLIDEHARRRIGEAMGEPAEIVWRVMDHEETNCAKEFNRSNSRNPERDCKAWIAERNKLHPEHKPGYQPRPYEVFPNYLGLTNAGARFVNWGLMQLDEPGRENLGTRMLGGETVVIALAAILFPEPT